MRKSILIITTVTLLILYGCGQGDKVNEKGKALYLTYCQGCHMDDGKGVPGMNAPLVGSAYVAGDKEKLVHIVLEGSAAFGDDPSRPYKNLMGPMPGLTDEEIANVLSYVRNSFGNKAPAVTTGEVHAVREKMK